MQTKTFPTNKWSQCQKRTQTSNIGIFNCVWSNFSYLLHEQGRTCIALSLNLVLLALLLAFALGRLGANLLVVLLEGSQVLTGLGELALLHALADVPVDEGALGVHQVELVVDAREELGDGRRVRHHSDGAHDLSQVAARHDGRWLVVDA